MKQKLLALVCALALVVSLAGCVISTPDTVGSLAITRSPPPDLLPSTTPTRKPPTSLPPTRTPPT